MDKFEIEVTFRLRLAPLSQIAKLTASFLSHLGEQQTHLSSSRHAMDFHGLKLNDAITPTRRTEIRVK